MTRWDAYTADDRGFRYEILDGSLRVTPVALFPHPRWAARLHRLLVRQCPDDVLIAEHVGVYVSPTQFHVPDIVVMRDEPDRIGWARPDEILIAIEMSRGMAYAAAGIPEYWIVDGTDRTLTVHRPNGDGAYQVHAVARPGRPYVADTPYPLAVDPAGVL